MSRIEVPYPFVKEKVTLPPDDPEGTKMVEVETWRPGVRIEKGDYPGDMSVYADDMGTMILIEVGRYAPPGFQERVFYQRRWRDPDGHEFGKKSLHIKAAGAFKSLAKGYRHHFDLP